MPSFPDRLKELRVGKGVTQKVMADFLGMIEQAYQRYELGTREPNHETTIKLADYFGVSLDYITGRTNLPMPLDELLTPEQWEAHNAGKTVTLTGKQGQEIFFKEVEIGKRK